MYIETGGLASRQAEKKVRSLFIGSRLRAGQGNVPGNQAPFKVIKRIFLGIGGQRLLASQEVVVHHFPGPHHCLGLGEVVGQLGGVITGFNPVELL